MLRYPIMFSKECGLIAIVLLSSAAPTSDSIDPKLLIIILLDQCKHRH